MRCAVVTIVGLGSLVAASELAAQGFCDDPASVCAATVEPRCLARTGAGALAAGDAGCAAQLTAYRACLARAAAECGGATTTAPSAACSREEARELWALAERGASCASYRAFVEACPEARRVAFAKASMTELGCGVTAPAGAAPTVSRDAQASFPTSADVLEAQRRLKVLKRYRGPIDGNWGRRSRLALKAFENSIGVLPGEGALTEQLLEALRAAPAPPAVRLSPRAWMAHGDAPPDRVFSSNEGVVALTMSPDGRTLVSAGRDMKIKIWDLESGALVRSIRTPSEPIHTLLSGHEHFFLSLGYTSDRRGWESTLKMWDLHTGRFVRQFEGPGVIRAAALMGDGARVLGVGNDFVAIWDIDTGKKIESFSITKVSPLALAVSPDLKYAVIVASGQGILLVDIVGKSSNWLVKSVRYLSDTVISQDGAAVLSANGWDLDIFSLVDGAPIRSLVGHESNFLGFQQLRDGRRLISGGADATLRIWDLGTGSVERTLHDEIGPPSHITLSPDARFAITGYPEGQLRIWDLEAE